MALVTITIRDDDTPEGNIDFNLESEPSLSFSTPARNTPAQALAIEIMAHLKAISQGVKVVSVTPAKR